VSPFQEAIDALAARDPMLASVIATSPPPTFRAHTHYYQTLVESIISQQLSVKAAYTIQQRFRALFGESFPSPEALLERTVEELRAVGLSRPKAAYIHDLARHILDGTVRFDTLDRLSNEAIVTELTSVKGIGEWTVHMFLIFCMGRLDVLPIGDLGIRNGVAHLYNLDAVPLPADVARIAQEHHWSPYESVASWYLWESLKMTPQIKK
jgi:DNA-3-methyladenine glycosylase II